MKTNQPGEKNPEEVMSNSAPGGSMKRKVGGRKRNPDERTVVDPEYRAPGRSYRRLEKKREARRKAQREEIYRREEETIRKAEEVFWRKVDETDVCYLFPTYF